MILPLSIIHNDKTFEYNSATPEEDDSEVWEKNGDTDKYICH